MNRIAGNFLNDNYYEIKTLGGFTVTQADPTRGVKVEVTVSKMTDKDYTKCHEIANEKGIHKW